MDKQARIRRELVQAEKAVDICYRMYRDPHRQYQFNSLFAQFVHNRERCRFFLKELLEVQLKEFNREG